LWRVCFVWKLRYGWMDGWMDEWMDELID